MSQYNPQDLYKKADEIKLIPDPVTAGPVAANDKSIRCPNCTEMTMQPTAAGHKCQFCGYLEKRK